MFTKHVQVVILSPELRAARADAKLSKDNQLEWVVELGPGEQKELKVKWSMEYPLNDHLIYNLSTKRNSFSYL